MSVLTFDFDPQVGAVLKVEIGPPASTHPVESDARRQIRMLVDTGAELSSVARKIADQIGLREIGKVPLISANQEFEAKQYLADLFIPADDGFVALRDVEIVEYRVGSLPDFDGLLGRDILQLCLVQLNGPARTFTLAF